MLEIKRTSKFEKDIKKYIKKHYDISKISDIIEKIAKSETLPTKYHDHNLGGNLQGCRECHIEDDVLLIYKILDNILTLLEIGNHRDLLGK
jgi:mRNA interferase YafQ